MGLDSVLPAVRFGFGRLCPRPVRMAGATAHYVTRKRVTDVS